jgi:hypothetical protein
MPGCSSARQKRPGKTRGPNQSGIRRVPRSTDGSSEVTGNDLGASSTSSASEPGSGSGSAPSPTSSAASSSCTTGRILREFLRDAGAASSSSVGAVAERRAAESEPLSRARPERPYDCPVREVRAGDAEAMSDPVPPGSLPIPAENPTDWHPAKPISTSHPPIKQRHRPQVASKREHARASSRCVSARRKRIRFRNAATRRSTTARMQTLPENTANGRTERP